MTRQFGLRRALCVSVAAMAALSAAGCGGGTAPGQPAATGADTRARALSASAGTFEPAATAQMAIVKKYNVVSDDRDTEASLLKRSIALLDAAGVPFQLLDCGRYVSDGSGGFPNYPPSWNRFSIASSDLAKAKSAGFEDFDSNSGYRFESPSVRGDLAEATAATSRVLQLAPVAYPELFPGLAAEGIFDGYVYAGFQNGNYVGVKAGRVYVHNGKNWNLQDVGAVRDFIKGF